jgi:two-component system, response regulator YesN
MYSVLIVDDEIHAVEGVKSGVNWESLHIANVYTAHNNRQAKEVFASHSIDIMLCDIEMPQGSGLELLAWVRESYPNTECIFLTCHADFDFAKKAIQLGSMDYILKPVPFVELEEVIKKAADKIDKEKELQQGSMLGEQWVKNQPYLVERFWHDILNGTIESNLLAIKYAADERSISFNEKQQVLPILISFQGLNESRSSNEERAIEQALKTEGEAFFFERNGFRGQVIRQGQEKLIVILFVEDELVDTENLKQQCESYVVYCHQSLGCDLTCYLGNSTQVDTFIGMVDELCELERNNVSFLNKVFTMDEKIVIDSHFSLPDMSLWSVMLQEGHYARVVEEASSFLKDINHEGIDAKKLRNFYHDFQQMIYYTLKQKGIQAHLIFNDNQSVHKLNHACRSVKDLIEWISHSISRVKEFSISSNKTDSVLEKAIQYITANIDQNIAREDIANEVYLNPDYLSRIFKRETGYSISEYIVNERMNISKELLEKTDMSVSSVATYVGYSNFSYFAKLFKKNLGLTPVEYRLKVQPKNTSL